MSGPIVIVTRGSPLALQQTHDAAARLQAALDLTRALEGHLTCVDVTPIPDFAGDIGGAAQAMILEEEREAETINRVALDARLAGEGVAWDWIDATGDFTQCLMRQAGLADVIVVNCKRDTMMAVDRRGVVASVVTQASCPVIAVPDDARGFNPNLPALVAWDGSEPCMATLRASVPLLRLAQSVTLFVVEDGPTRAAPVEAAAAYLSRHDVHATIEQVAADGATPDALITTTRARFDNVSVTASGGAKTAETEVMPESISNEKQIDIYPNPARDMVNVVYPYAGIPVTVTLYSANGSAVKTITLSNNETQVDVSSLQPGVYILRFRSAEAVNVKRLVIQ